MIAAMTWNRNYATGNPNGVSLGRSRFHQATKAPGGWDGFLLKKKALLEPWCFLGASHGQSKQQQNNALYLPLHPQIYILNLATLSSVLDPSLSLHLRPDGQTGWVSQSLSLRLAVNYLVDSLRPPRSHPPR